MQVQLHLTETQERIKFFAQEKMSRALVIAKVDKSASADNANQDKSKIEVETQEVSGFEIVFSDKVEFLGPTAQTIAFLKRENYARLDLKPPLDQIDVMNQSITSAATSPSDASGSVINLSAQL